MEIKKILVKRRGVSRLDRDKHRRHCHRRKVADNHRRSLLHDECGDLCGCRSLYRRQTSRKIKKLTRQGKAFSKSFSFFTLRAGDFDNQLALFLFQKPAEKRGSKLRFKRLFLAWSIHYTS